MNEPLKWYTVRCRSQRERRSEGRIQSSGFETYLPRFKRNRHGQSSDTAALFPGYFFLLHTYRPTLTPEQKGWDIYQFLDEPVPDSAIDELRSRETAGLIRLPEPFALGAGVEITDYGSGFFGQHGLYQGMTADDRVSVLLSILGRPFVGRFKFNNVRALAYS